MARLFGYNRPEWPYLIPAVLGALIDGAAMPLCTIALVGSMEGFFKEKEEMRQDLEPRLVQRDPSTWCLGACSRHLVQEV